MVKYLQNKNNKVRTKTTTTTAIAITLLLVTVMIGAATLSTMAAAGQAEALTLNERLRGSLSEKVTSSVDSLKDMLKRGGGGSGGDVPKL